MKAAEEKVASSRKEVLRLRNRRNHYKKKYKDLRRTLLQNQPDNDKDSDESDASEPGTSANSSNVNTLRSKRKSVVSQ